MLDVCPASCTPFVGVFVVSGCEQLQDFLGATASKRPHRFVEVFPTHLGVAFVPVVIDQNHCSTHVSLHQLLYQTDVVKNGRASIETKQLVVGLQAHVWICGVLSDYFRHTADGMHHRICRRYEPSNAAYALLRADDWSCWISIAHWHQVRVEIDHVCNVFSKLHTATTTR